MDTATHFILGISIAGLSTLDQSIAQEPAMSQGILVGTLIGSQAPDFDGLSRLWGGTAGYIKHHRGITHSLPAILLWPTVIAMALTVFYSNIIFTHLWFWIFLSVLLHVTLDLFNAYGTQVLRPFSEKWVSFNVLNIFDPFIFLIHITASLLWVTSTIHPANIFIAAFMLTFAYLLWRLYIHGQTAKAIKSKFEPNDKITVLPTIKQFTWNFIKEDNQSFEMGLIDNRKISILDSKKKQKPHKALEAAKKDKKVEAFLYFTSFAYPEWKKTSFGYEVRFIDLRYRFHNHYPFVALTLLDEQYHVIDSYTGWVYNENNLDKKIRALLKS